MKRKVYTAVLLVILFVLIMFGMCMLAPGFYIPNDLFNGACVVIFIGGLIFG